MTAPMQLHCGYTHTAMRVLFVVVATFFTAGGMVMAWPFPPHPITLAVGSMVAFAVLLAWALFGRARPVWVEGEYLVVGRGKRPRRVHCLDVLTVQHPWYAFGLDKLTLPQEITVRDGASIFFFPAQGAEHLIFGARRHARDLAEGRRSFE